MLISVKDLLRLKGDAVWSVPPGTSVVEALSKLAEKDIGALLVVEGGQIAGIISERDVVRKIAATGMFEPAGTVSEYMTPDVFTISPAQTIEDCMALMTEQRIRHLPVVEDDKLVGMISIGDVVKAIITSQEFTIDQLTKFIDGGGYNQ
ncbi:MAG: CBS domain-containing protein [Brevefilum sp.]|nr:CBS domain-containing protein [Brevefilum sp.]